MQGQTLKYTRPVVLSGLGLKLLTEKEDASSERGSRSQLTEALIALAAPSTIHDIYF
jgi:hypothetical protein